MSAALDEIYQSILNPVIAESLQEYEVMLNLDYTMEAFQHRDWLSATDKSVKNRVLVRSRSGSKSFDFSQWLIWISMREGSNKKDGKNAWLAPTSGNLEESLGYFEANPFVVKVKTITHLTYYKVHLTTGDIIDVRVVGKGIVGKRYKLIVWDEFQDLTPIQEAKYHLKVLGTQAKFKDARSIYIGTLWMGTKFIEYSEAYETTVTPWNKIQFLVDAGHVQFILDDHSIPEWFKDLEYRCIPTAPSGLVFKPTLELPFDMRIRLPEQYGVDFGGMDTWCGILEEGLDIFILAEGQVCLDKYPDALAFMKGQKICVESGGYNTNKAGGMTHKASTMVSQILAATQAPTQTFKAEIVMYVNGRRVYCDRDITPNIFKDIRKAVYGKDGLYEKTHGAGTLYQNHYLDAFLLSLRAGQQGYLDNGRTIGNRFKIMASEKARNMRFS